MGTSAGAAGSRPSDHGEGATCAVNTTVRIRYGSELRVLALVPKEHVGAIGFAIVAVVAHYCDRDMLIDAALSLFQSQGFEATTIGQIAMVADVAAFDVTRYFATTDAVIMSIVDDLLDATAVALQGLAPTVLPAEALLLATTEMLAAIIEGHGVMTQERMLAMAHIVTTSPDLRRQVSTRRKNTLTTTTSCPSTWPGSSPTPT